MRRFNAFLLLPFLAAAAPLPAGRGRPVVQRVCTRCHDSSVITTQRHSRTEWEGVVREMQNAGARASKAEVRQIVDYLTRTFPDR